MSVYSMDRLTALRAPSVVEDGERPRPISEEAMIRSVYLVSVVESVRRMEPDISQSDNGGCRLEWRGKEDTIVVDVDGAGENDRPYEISSNDPEFKDYDHLSIADMQSVIEAWCYKHGR